MAMVAFRRGLYMTAVRVGGRFGTGSDRRFLSDAADAKMDRALMILEQLEAKMPAAESVEKLKNLEDRLSAMEVQAYWGGVLMGVFGTVAVAVPGVCYTMLHAVEDYKTKYAQMEKDVTSLKDQVRKLELRNEMADLPKAAVDPSASTTEAVELSSKDTPLTPGPTTVLPAPPQTTWFSWLRSGV